MTCRVADMPVRLASLLCIMEQAYVESLAGEDAGVMVATETETLDEVMVVKAPLGACEVNVKGTTDELVTTIGVGAGAAGLLSAADEGFEVDPDAGVSLMLVHQCLMLKHLYRGKSLLGSYSDLLASCWR